MHDCYVPYTAAHRKFWEERNFIEERMKVCEDENFNGYILNCESFSFNDDKDFQTVIHGVIHQWLEFTQLNEFLVSRY